MKGVRTYIVALAVLALILTATKVSAAALIQKFEGFRDKAYLDSANVYTIGYGSTRNPITGEKVKKGDTITRAKALNWLKIQTAAFAKDIDTLVKVPINDNERTALLSFVYNIGTTRFKSSTLLRKLNANAPRAEVAKEFMRWVYAGGKVVKGLQNRRATEQALFLS